MAGPPQALAHWPGVDQFESFSGTIQHGITPSVFRLTIAPQRNNIPTSGTLTLSFGGQKVVEFPNCIIDNGSYVFDSNGYLISFQILDRRWKWRYGIISGRFNVRNDDGTIKGEGIKREKVRDRQGEFVLEIKGNAAVNTKRTPQELAKLCFEAQAEEGFDFATLPDGTFPLVEWDPELPMEALQGICEDLGCRVILGLDNKAKIVKLGEGRDLPNGPIFSDQMLVDPPERPDSITCVTAPVLHEHDFLLEAVGLDTDNKIKKIDDLSYKPASGWGRVDLPDMLNVTDEAARNIAKETVFRWYRIVTPQKIPFGQMLGGKIEAEWEVDKLDEILPIDTHQVQLNKDGQRMPAIVYGVWNTESLGSLENTATKITPPKDLTSRQIYNRGFSLDTERGIVQFSEPVYRRTPSAAVPLQAAILRLRTATAIRDGGDGQPMRYYRKQAQPEPKLDTLPLFIKHEDIQPATFATYTDEFKIKQVFGNFTQVVDPQCDYYIKAEAIKFLLKNPQVRTYAGIHGVGSGLELDGAIQSIAWEISAAGGFTKVARNTDLGSETTPPYAMKRLYEKLGNIAKAGKLTVNELEIKTRRMKKGKG